MTAEKTMTHLDHVTSVPTLSSLRDTDRTISSSDQDIRGRMVKDKDGRDLGRIEDLLVDDIERKVRFMEVATGGFLGFGESKSFIPIDAITRMTPDEVYISHTREHVPAHLAMTQTSSRPICTTSSICTRTTDTRRPSGYSRSRSLLPR